MKVLGIDNIVIDTDDLEIARRFFGDTLRAQRATVLTLSAARHCAHSGRRAPLCSL